MADSSIDGKPIKDIQRSIHHTLSQTIPPIHHVQRLLSHTSTLDTTLLTLTYTLSLLKSLLPRLPATSSLKSALPPLLAILSEYRILLRLPGLLSIYTGAVATYLSPPKDRLLQSLAWAQLISIALFQALENAAFLADKGVLKWKPGRSGKASMWSCRAWMVYVGLELGKLGYEYQARTVKSPAEGKEKGIGERQIAEGILSTEMIDSDKNLTELERKAAAMEEKEWLAGWKTRLAVNAAYAPMTVHYSFANGFLSDHSSAALGCIVAWLTFGDAWRKTA